MSQKELSIALGVPRLRITRQERVEKGGTETDLMMRLALVGLDALGLTKRKDGK